jgi:hypothetical protein
LGASTKGAHFNNKRQMKKLLIAFGLFAIACFGQEQNKIDLKWKIGEHEKLTYLTSMSDVDADSSIFQINFRNHDKMFTDSTKEGMAEAISFFKTLSQTLNKFEYITTLTNKGKGIIDILMTARTNNEDQKADRSPTKNDEEEIIKKLYLMNYGVMLRGSVYETGGIHSFWIKSDQENLIALLFELPKKPVQVGDTWSLEVNLISNDQNFVCDSSYNENKVTLIDLKNVDGNSVAILKYYIVEYVKGGFITPGYRGNKSDRIETVMKFEHQAIGEFSVNKGRWLTYDGLMTLETTGMVTAKKKTKFSLFPE